MPKRRGRPSAAQTPAPQSDKLVGSKTNKAGSATSKGSSKINLSDKTLKTLKQKIKDFKEKYPKNQKASLNDLKAVYRRGSGAYSGTHRPTITGGAPNSRAAWSFARVNKFLEKAAGKKVKAAYVQDDDLLKYEEGGSIESFKKVMYDNKSGSIVPYNAMYGKDEIYYKYKNALIKYSKIDEKWVLWMIDDEKQQTTIGGYKTLKIAKEVALYYLKNPTKYEEGGNVGQEITCRNCGWHWNTNKSNEYDKYVCHKCGFDNRTYYEPSPIGKYEKGGKINNMDNKKALNGSTGGMLVGNRHSEGGIKAINKSSNTPLEMEGGEVVITRNAVSDGSKREFEGKMMTNKEILSKINESGGGVSFAEGGKVHECACSGKHYKYGGRTMSDHDIVKEMREMYPNDFAKGVKEELSEHRKTLEELVNKKIKVSDAADLIVTEHLRKKPNYYKEHNIIVPTPNSPNNQLPNKYKNKNQPCPIPSYSSSPMFQ